MTMLYECVVMTFPGYQKRLLNERGISFVQSNVVPGGPADEKVVAMRETDR
jgi:hypothetical protein